MMTTAQKIARCPHCGHDEFIVSESENKVVRLVGLETYPYRREEEISSEGRGYDAVVCGGCGADLNPQKWADSALPAEAC